MRELLEDSIERLLSARVEPKLLNKVDADQHWAEELWREVEDAGFTLALVPAEAGGAGAAWADVFTLFRAAGRHAAPIPLPDTILANWLLAEAGLELPGGPISLAVPQLGVTGGHADGRLTGAAWGRNAGHVLTVTEGPEPVVLLFDRAALALEPKLDLAREPHDDFRLEGHAPIAAGALPGRLPSDTLLLAGALARAAQIAGGLQRALDLAVRYAQERVQFGRPIGSFQAIQQQLAVLAEQTSLALIAADAAFAFAAEDLPETPIASAKVTAGEAATAGAAIAHAVHGAIGVTHEHSLHFTTRRLWAWRNAFGSERFWAERLGRAAAARGPSAFWPHLTTPLAAAEGG